MTSRWLEAALWYTLLLSAALAVAGWLVTVPWPAWAQHPGHAENHNWYQHLKTPHGYSCCMGDMPGKLGDCRPVQARPLDDGSWEAFFGGQWRPIPPERVLPDGLNLVPLRSHLCEQDGFVRCFLRGGAGT